jgi:hypothetical protein
LLTSILDAGITTNVIRLGSRTKNERVAQYSLNKLERDSRPEDLGRKIGREYAGMKSVEKNITKIMNRIQLPSVTWEVAERFLRSHYPNHANSFLEPPSWIMEVFQQVIEDENKHGVWTRVSKGREVSEDSQISGIYGFWKNGRDIEFIQALSPSMKPENERGDDPQVAFFDKHGFPGQIPPVPSECRSLECLTTDVNDVWSMSQTERKCLKELWEDEIRQQAFDSNLAEYEALRARYMNVCSDFENMNDEVS